MKINEDVDLPTAYWGKMPLFAEWKGSARTMPALDMDNELQPEFSLYFTSIKKQ